MRILNRYLTNDFLVIFAMTVLILTFVMCIGVIVRAIDFAARGISGVFILKIFIYNIPYMLTFTIPMGILTAVLLLFGRLSFDGELTAMRACGLNLWQILAPILVVSVLASGLCMYINATVAPTCKHLFRQLVSDIGIDEPANLLEPGRFVREFPNLMIYVGDRDGNTVEDIVVYEMDESGPVRNVRAERGEIRTEQEERAMYVDLYNVRIDQRDAGADAADLTKSHYINAEYYPVKLDFSRMARRSTSRKTSDMTMRELITNIRDVRSAYPELEEADLRKQRMKQVVELNKRLALSISCFAFTLLGVPLGMRSKRKESSVGFGVALMLVFLFYLFIIIANSLVDKPQLRPDLIVWIPVFAAEIAGIWMIWRMN